ncbi:MAG: hypothetical protein ACJ77K_02995 [Bacteroidia bacterium]
MKIKHAFITGMILLAACKTTKTTTESKPVTETKPEPTPLNCGTSTASFADVKAIVEQNCTSCHHDLANYNDIKDIAAKGEFLGTIKHQMGYPEMPKNADQLPQSTIDKVECWIKNGMKQ